MVEPSQTGEPERLQAYLTEQLDEQIVDTALLEAGLNRIFRVATADNPRAYILRQPDEGRDGAGFVDVHTEHAVLSRLEPTDVPAPTPVHYCDDASVLGTPFSIMEYAPGEPIGWDESLPVGYRTRSARDRVGQLLIDRLATLHSTNPERFDTVCDGVSLREQVDRTIGQLEAATSATTHDPVMLWRVADWLQETVPEQAEPTLVHGDYKPDNVLFRWVERPTVAAILDWETATLLDPRTELGYFCLLARTRGSNTRYRHSVRATSCSGGRHSGP